MNWKQALRHQIKSVLRTPANWLVASSSIFARRVDECLRTTTAIIDNGTLSAKFYPLLTSREPFPSPSLALPPGTPAVPPQELMEGYGPEESRYLRSGLEDFRHMEEALKKHGLTIKPKDRVLDFGCAAGRMIRHGIDQHPDAAFFGVDISAAHTQWCQRHLRPAVFLTTTTFPHLPFSDGYFKGIYCGSVFTHIGELSEFWLWELRRILAPGAWLYATIHDRTTIEILQTRYPDFFLSRMVKDHQHNTGFLDGPFGMAALSCNPKDTMVFYEHHFIERSWGQVFDVLGFFPEAYGYQTGVVLRKPSYG